MIIRQEIGADIPGIAEATRAAFENHPYSQGAEVFIVSALRAAGVLTISLAAEEGGRVVGRIAFSPVTISDGSGGWHGIGPVSVLPAWQRRGVGKALMGEGLARLRALGGQGCALVGDPAYYKRSGFRNYPELVHEGVPPENFMALPFAETVPRGTMEFHPGFLAAY